jgi:hypothetical protein
MTMTDASQTDRPHEQGGDAGVAPADAVPHNRWPKWRIVLAYLLLSGVALGSVWIIDEHVLSAVDPLTPTAAPR